MARTTTARVKGKGKGKGKGTNIGYYACLDDQNQQVNGLDTYKTCTTAGYHWTWMGPIKYPGGDRVELAKPPSKSRTKKPATRRRKPSTAKKRAAGKKLPGRLGQRKSSR
jgi:hypothetical protein